MNDDRTFTIDASPYMPEFNGYAFAYEPVEDHFGGARAEHPISEEGVDIVMTDGPPLLPGSQDYVLDVNREGNHCGCPMPYDAIRQARPKLHCFGHIHEGYGFQGVRGKPQDMELGPVSRDSTELRVGEDGRTVLVNAAVMNHGEGDHSNKPWVVRLELDYQTAVMSAK